MAGPLAMVRDGDEIQIDVGKRSIQLLVSDQEIQERARDFHWTFNEGEYPRFLNLFVKNVGSMAKGGIWE